MRSAPSVAALGVILSLSGAVVAVAVAGKPPAAGPSAAPQAAGPATAPQARPSSTAPKTTVDTTVRFAPRAHKLSLYTIDARYSMHFKSITFEVPEAYRDSFNFWTGRMKGRAKYEVYQFTIRTLDPGEDGAIPFTREVPHFNLELSENGQTRVPYDPLEQKLRTWKWEGTLDPLGNMKDLRKVAGREDDEFANLAMGFVDSAFPVVKAAQDMSIGTGFDEERIVPLPEPPPKIAGLENLRLKLNRTYRLKEFRGGQAVFEVGVKYVLDPAATITVPDTRCTMVGGGTGEAVFDLARGLFVSTRLPTTLVIDISAPLRPLPDKPETANPGNGETHIEMEMTLETTQVVTRPWGEEQAD